ncbi:glycerol-3-phosphate dehydrogenase [Pararobbsia alpina]
MTTDFDIEIDPAQMRAGDPRSTNSRKALLTRLRQSQFSEEKAQRAAEDDEETAEPQRPSVSPRGEPPRDWDVIVIGGGATGLGVAVDAVTRGFRTLLLEQRDFASGTSSKATKLVHGGVRYLAQRNFPLVKEALHERGLLLKNAPHLTRPLGFVVPTYKFIEKPFYQIGLKVYDRLAGPLNIQRSRGLSRAQTLEAAPTIATEHLRGGVMYYDAQFDDARLAVTLARTIADHGGLALNYMKVTGFLKFQDPMFPLSTHRVSGVEVTDTETGESFELTAHCVINATGVWVDSVRRLDDANAYSTVKPSQGTHLVLSREFLPGDKAILVPRTDDGRVLFMVPWQGHTLIGTTDTQREDLTLNEPSDPAPLDDEIDFILETASRYLSRAPKRSDVLSAWAGLRPLADSGPAKGPTSQISREHTISVSNSGLVSVTGGKWTTYRKMAEDVMDTTFTSHLLETRPGMTESLRLHGAPRPGDEFDSHYGSDAHIVSSIEGADEQIVPQLDLTIGQVRYAARCEYARTVEDVLARRHRGLLLNARAALAAAPRVALTLALELGQPPVWIEKQLKEFAKIAEPFRVTARDSGPETNRPEYQAAINAAHQAAAQQAGATPVTEPQPEVQAAPAPAPAAPAPTPAVPDGPVDLRTEPSLAAPVAAPAAAPTPPQSAPAPIIAAALAAPASSESTAAAPASPAPALAPPAPAAPAPAKAAAPTPPSNGSPAIAAPARPAAPTPATPAVAASAKPAAAPTPATARAPAALPGPTPATSPASSTASPAKPVVPVAKPAAVAAPAPASAPAAPAASQPSSNGAAPAQNATPAPARKAS